MRTLIPVVSVALLAPFAASAQTSVAQAAANLRQVQQALGVGAQLYECQALSGTPAFAFVGPDAVLYQFLPEVSGIPVPVATNTSGPVWTWRDGSGVVGTVVLTEPSGAPNSIPQLLLRTTNFGTAGGALSTVSFITRTGTNGGTAPTAGCDAAHIGTIARVPYTATYTFYAAAQ